MLFFPQKHQIIYEKNVSYFRSVFIGLTAPILLFPDLLWMAIVKPLFCGVFVTLHTILKIQIMGLQGMVNGRNMTLKQFVQLCNDKVDANDK